MSYVNDVTDKSTPTKKSKVFLTPTFMPSLRFNFGECENGFYKTFLIAILIQSIEMCFWVVLIHSISRVWCPKDLFSVTVCKGFTMELLRPCSGHVMVRGSQGRDDMVMADFSWMISRKTNCNDDKY